MEEIEKICEDLFLIKQPYTYNSVKLTGVLSFTGVTVIVGKENIGLFVSGIEMTPEDYIFPFVLKLGRKLDDINYVVNSHLHSDHIGGNKVIRNEASMKQVKFVAHRLDAEAIGKVDLKLKGEELIKLGDRQFRVIHTPGHTSGSISLYDEKNRTLLTGDAVEGHGLLEGHLNLVLDKKEYINSLNRLLALKIDLLMMSHPYTPILKAILVGNEPINYIQESIKGAKQFIL